MLRSTLILTAASLALFGAQTSAVPLMLDAEVNVNPSKDTPVEVEAKREMFEEFDVNNDGYIENDEAEALPSVDEGVYGADDFARIDNDSDGKVDFQEFATYLNTDDAEIAQFNADERPATEGTIDDDDPEGEGVGDGK